VEKVATQIIKNVQVKITDIHIRYEDKVTKPEHPFSLGITLHNLSVHTTDENWKACVVQDAATMIYKVRNKNMFYVQSNFQNSSRVLGRNQGMNLHSSMCFCGVSFKTLGKVRRVS
jgi:Vacuolar protein sorting-associated protein